MPDYTGTLDEVITFPTLVMDAGGLIKRDISYSLVMGAGGILKEQFPAEGVITPAVLYTIVATGTVGDGNHLIQDTPVPTLIATGGAVAGGTFSPLSLTMAGTTDFVGALDSGIEFPTISATGITAYAGVLDAVIGQMSLSGIAGAIGKGNKIAVPTLVAAGSTWITGVLARNVPRATISATGTLPIMGRLDQVIPAMRMVQPNAVIGNLPLMQLVALGTVGTSLGYVAFSVNAKTGALTQFNHWTFVDVVRWKGKYYGVNGSGIFLIGGIDSDGTDLAWEATVPDIDFGAREQKRMIDVYVQSRAPADHFVSLSNDEGSDILYNLTGKPATGIGRRRIRAAKGPKGSYWTLKLSGDDTPQDIDEVEMRAHILGRRLQ